MNHPAVRLVVVGLMWFMSTWVYAAEHGIVVVRQITAQSWPEAERRACAELEASGFRVIEVSESSSEPTEGILQDVSKTYAAAAAIAISRSERSRDEDMIAVEVSVFDVARNAFRKRTTGVPRNAAIAPEEQVALLSVEMVRAVLLDPLTPERPVPRVPIVRARRKASGPPNVRRTFDAPRAGVRTGLTATGALGDLGFLGGALIGGSWYPVARMGLDGELALTAIPARLSSMAGETWVGFVVSRVHLSLLAFPRAFVSPSVGVGGGAIVVWSSAISASSHVARPDAAVGGLLGIRAGLALRVARALRLQFEARTAITIPEGAVLADRHPLARFGRPLLEGALVLEWLWPR